MNDKKGSGYKAINPKISSIHAKIGFLKFKSDKINVVKMIGK